MPSLSASSAPVSSHHLAAAWPLALLLAAAVAGLWLLPPLSAVQQRLWSLALLVCACAPVLVRHRQWPIWLALALQAGALATVSSALELRSWHLVFKPLAMVFAIAAVAASAHQQRAESRFGFKNSLSLLGLALLLSLSGDVCLMLDGLFLPGLVSFLLAHLCYLALFRQGQAWWPHRGALLGTLVLGVAVYAFLWQGGLPAGLRGPVAAYVLAIALMAAQAWGRWHVLRDGPSLLVALGASLFMLSDTLLATHRFVQPLAWSQLWVLSSYYAAQLLIVRGWLRGAFPAPVPERQPAALEA